MLSQWGEDSKQHSLRDCALVPVSAACRPSMMNYNTELSAKKIHSSLPKLILVMVFITAGEIKPEYTWWMMANLIAQ